MTLFWNKQATAISNLQIKYHARSRWEFSFQILWSMTKLKTSNLQLAYHSHIMTNLISFVSYVKLFSSLSQWLFHCHCVRVVARKNSYWSNIKMKVSISSLLRNMFFHYHTHKKLKNLTMANALLTSMLWVSVAVCLNHKQKAVAFPQTPMH